VAPVCFLAGIVAVSMLMVVVRSFEVHEILSSNYFVPGRLWEAKN
jgi:hypothetical protein